MKKLILSSVVVALGCACAIPVPATKAKMGNIEFALPKDYSARDLEIVVLSGTNRFTLKAKYLSSKNNPEVIASSAAGEVDVIKAHYEGSANLLSKAIEGAVKGAK